MTTTDPERLIRRNSRSRPRKKRSGRRFQDVDFGDSGTIGQVLEDDDETG